ncbi:FKBP-type peptidyl-prolyl cis-trans isomerase [Microbacterium sp. CJ88]|uniref:FKBP-type peptidyl-prolyl cis-trans isomerase n=1 Tax=Microbacterium sp. CJ88 TaxID=3445672 RepID=UPI003F654C96
MRARRLATLSIAAAAALLLAGCTAAGNGTASGAPSPSGSPTDLCAAAAPSGATSDAVKVDGAAGAEATLTFTSPLDVTTTERTVISQGQGDPVQDGQFVSYAITAYNAQTGEKLGAVGYNPGEILPAAVSTTTASAQIFGCIAPGGRVVLTSPGTNGNPGEVDVFDLLAVVPTAATGAAQPPVDGMPTVTLDDTGKPTITIPSGAAAPTDVKIADLKTGDGAVVAPGDKVLVQYTGVLWPDGTEFDSSWTRGTPASFQTTGVVPGFQQALEGQKVGSQVLVVIPPAFGYGDTAQGSIPAGSTLVFVIDILGTQHAAAQ